MDKIAVENEIKKVISEYLCPNDDMTLFAAQKLSQKIREKAAKMGVNPVVAITNKGANPVLVECTNNSYIASYDIALNKAYTSVALKMSTKELSKLAKPEGSLYGIQFTNDGKIVIFGGGEYLTSKDGTIIGGLGVSGGSEEQDTELAKYGKEVFEKGLN